MKTSVLLTICLTTLILAGMAQQSESNDKTLSPYFYVHTDDPETDQLPLKSTEVQVDISGVMASVSVRQIYKNEGRSVLEAIYIFPGSTRAAVNAMKMTIGERTIEAKIEEKMKAREAYEEAKRNGQTASLLEQQRPNVFQMNVANILPGDKIEVELTYTELLVPEDDVYSFIYPTVVGPRYSNTPEDLATANERWVSNPYTSEGELPFYTLSIDVRLNAGMPVQEVLCKTHETYMQFLNKKEVDITLKESEKFSGNKDFNMQYKLKGSLLESGLLLYEGKTENFFLLMMQPPARVKPENIPPREYVFIVDVSGSMHGFPLDVSKALLKDLLSNLRTSDKFNVLLFAGASNTLSEKSLAATATNVERAINFIDRQQGGGGTELLPALEKAMALKGTEGFSRTFVIATDGYVTVEKETFDLIRENLGAANFFTFGIGSSVNRYLVEGMAHLGKGETFVATNKTEAIQLAAKFRNLISSPVLTNINLEFNGFDVYDQEPLEVPDVFSDRPVLVYGKYTGEARGSIQLTGKTGNGEYNQGIDLQRLKPEKSNSAIRYLWARERIRILDDYTNLAMNDQHSEEITNLGLKYNLLTAYTSFIAVDSEVRNQSGESVVVKQPLPLPEGVSNYAVGASSPGAYKRSGKGFLRTMLGQGCAGAVEVDLSSAEEKLSEENTSNDYDVESAPRFKGGETAFKNFISKHLNYPAEAPDIEGTVFIEFVVNFDGTIENVRVVRSLHSLLDAEALRVIKLSSGKWIPGEQGGMPYRGCKIVRIEFEL